MLNRVYNLLFWVKLTSSVTLLSACTTLGPEYQEPETSWAENWHPDLYGHVSSLKANETSNNTSNINVNPKPKTAPENQKVNPDITLWWKTFNDPVLDKLIDIAQQENLNLRIAGLRILESRARLGIADSTLYPQVQQISSSALATKTRRRGGALPDSDDDFLSYDASYSLGWELDFWGKFKRSIEAADASFFSSIANYYDMQVLLNAQIANLYFSYRTTELRIYIAKKNAEIQKRSYEITEKVFESGQDSELDLQQAKSQYLATLSSIPRLEMSLIRTRNAIATVLGRPPGSIPELPVAKRDNVLPHLEHITVDELPAELLLRRPDIRASAYTVAAQSAQIGIAEADFYPSISLIGTLGWSSSSLDSASDNSILAGGPSVSWNIFDFGRIENNIRVQDARLQQVIESYQANVLSAAREIDDAAIGVVKTREQIKIYTESVKASERALTLANQRYREGYSDFQRVLDAQRAFFSQTEQELINRGNHITAVIDVYKALGGGWYPKTIEEMLPAETRKTMTERSDWGDVLAKPHSTIEPKSSSNEKNNSSTKINAGTP